MQFTDTASAGNGGVATASANGGAVGIGDVNSGGNAGNAIGVGDTWGGTVAVDGGDVTGSPPGSFPVTVAVLTIEPLSTSPEVAV